MMVREHAFNSRWYGLPVGLVTDPAFFLLDPAEQDALCSPYAWLEYRGTLDRSAAEAIMRARFFYVDTQVAFRVRLKGLMARESARALHVVSAAESHILPSADHVVSYDKERFFALPGMTHERVRQRYLAWCADLVRDAPDLCLAVRDASGTDQGWFFAQRATGGLNLTLAMLARSSTVGGALFYQRALLAYAERGFSVGHASYSVSNTAVQNIYASLGAITTRCQAFHFRVNQPLER